MFTPRRASSITKCRSVRLSPIAEDSRLQPPVGVWPVTFYFVKSQTYADRTRTNADIYDYETLYYYRCRLYLHPSILEKMLGASVLWRIQFPPSSPSIILRTKSLRGQNMFLF